MTDADGLLAMRFAATRDGEDDADWNDVLRRRQPGRDRHLRVLVAAAAVVAGLVAALLATPALGLVRDIIPFWGAAKAPQPVVIEFASMNTGAPAGMSPRAVAGETREIGQFTFAGRSHTLWIAPAKDGGFCFEWIGGWGGCDTERSSESGVERRPGTPGGSAAAVDRGPDGCADRRRGRKAPPPGSSALDQRLRQLPPRARRENHLH